MMRVLLVFPEEKVRGIVLLALDGKYRVDAKIATNSEQAITTLNETGSEFDLIIADFAKCAKRLIQYQEGSKKKQSWLFWRDKSRSQFKVPEKMINVQAVNDTDTIELFYAAIESLVPDQSRVRNRTEPTDYCRVSAPLLLASSPLRSDVYISLSKEKYLKIFREGDMFEAKDLDKYHVQKKIEYFHLRSQDCGELIKKLKDALLSLAAELQEGVPATASEPEVQDAEKIKVAATPVVSPAPLVAPPPPSTPVAVAGIDQAKKAAAGPAQEQSKEQSKEPSKERRPDEQAEPAKPVQTPQKAALDPQKLQSLKAAIQKDPAAANQVLHELSTTLGFTPEVQELARANMHATVAAIKKGSKLSNILASFDRNPEKYIPTHSMMVAHFACMLASQMEWKSDTTFQKFTMAAMLHDISIKNQDLAAVGSLDELELVKDKYTKEELAGFKNHMITAAEMARGFAEIPPDVDIIIQEHHERPDGKGFPRALMHTRISALSSVFIVAHDMVDFIFEQEAGFKFTPVFLDLFHEKYKEVYILGNFKKVLRIIQKLDF